MATQPQRKRRLELPAPPSTTDPTAIQRYLADIRRLTMDEFNRLSGDFFDFRAETIASATIPLASVAAITVDAGQYDATFTWENPVQPQGIPTHVRVRIAEFGDTWQEYTYPLTTYTAYGLSPDTTYTFQIQLVRREQATVSFVNALRNCPSLPVQIESTSEIRSRSFSTDPGIGVPGPDDDGDPVIPVPDTDDPGPVGGTHCWWEWQIQVVNLTTGQWDDTTHSGFIAGDAGEIDLSGIIETLDPLRVYRTKIREICNGIPGPWEYGPPWTGGADWADNCGGLEVSDSYGAAPFSEADLWVIPYLCFVAGEGLFIREYLSGVEIIPGAGYKQGWTDAEGEVLLFGEEWSGSPATKLMGSTYLPVLTTIDNSDDLSIYMELKFPTFPSIPGGAPYGTENIISIGDGKINFNVTWDAIGNWGIQFSAPREIGGNLTLNSPLTINSGTSDWASVLVSIDNDGDKIMVLDGSVVASDETGDEIRLDGMTGAMQIRAITEMRIRKFYGWNQLVGVDGWLFVEDDFNRTTGLGSNWSGHTGQITIVDNELDGHNGITGREIYWAFPCASENLWAEIDIIEGGGVWGQPCIIFSDYPTTAGASLRNSGGYTGAPPGPSSGLTHWGLGSTSHPSIYMTALHSPAGHRMRMEREDQVLRWYMDGVLYLTTPETGLGMRYVGLRVSDGIVMDNFQAGVL